ncbi:MAG: hypothetical protein CMI26_14865 [Opitutae bacterium]|nr:hypothetical protein [Opitutae bacterium]
MTSRAFAFTHKLLVPDAFFNLPALRNVTERTYFSHCFFIPNKSSRLTGLHSFSASHGVLLHLF